LTLSQSIILVDTFARLHLKGEARQYWLGYFWWILEPMLYVGVFYLVFEKLLQNRQPDFLYFLMVGKLVFIWFSKSINQSANALRANAGLIAQTSLRKEILPLAVVHQGFYRQLVVFGFLLSVLLLGGFGVSAVWWWLIPLVLVQALLTTACGLLAALLVCIQRDFRLLLQLGTVFLLFISGVFWDPGEISDEALRDWLMVVNPLATLIDAYRQVLILGMPPSAERLLWVLVGSVFLLSCGLIAYQHLQFWIARQVVSR
jgi:lipopolysaccharide transport system permease protein